MRPWKPALLLLFVFTLFTAPLHAENNAELKSSPGSVEAARVADHENLLQLEVGPYLKLIFPPDTFSEDTAVTANLDLENRRLSITTRGGDVSRTPAQIRLALPDLQGGLQIEYDHQTDLGSRLEGTFVDRAEEPMPQIVAMMSDTLEPFVIDNSTVVLLSEDKSRAQRIRWTDLAYGDHVSIRYGKGRRASAIEAIRSSGEGVVESLVGSRLKLVGAVTPMAVSPHARFEGADGTSFEFESLRPKDRITLRIDSKTREVWHVTRVEMAPGEMPRLVVTHDGTGRLVPGDRIQITGTGTPGGTLTIDIVNVESNLEAKELRSDPGTYVLTYTIPRGISLDETPIVARLDLPNAPSTTVLAEAPLTFTASTDGGGEEFSEAPDQAKPDTPVITSPNDGEKIKNSMTVSGTAASRQKVRITIDYTVTRSIVLLGEGRLFEKQVSADSRGVFTTGEIPAEVKSLFGGDTDYRITVIAVSEKGVESEPAVVSVRRPD